MKIVGWISKLLVSAILVSTISVVTTAYIVNSYITQLLKPLNLQISQKPLELSDIWSNLWGKSNILGQEGTVADAPVSAKGNGNVTGNDPGSGTKSSASQVGKEDSVAAWAQTGNSASTNSSQSQERALVMSEEQFQTKKEQLSNEDKLVIFSALSKLPEADMQTISTLVEDGITSSELTEVEKLVEQHLKPEEYKRLLQILQKYE